MPDRNRHPDSSDTLSDILRDLPPEKQLIHVIDTLARQRNKTEAVIQDVSIHIRETGARLAGVETALNKIADLEKQMQEDRVRSEKTFERIGSTLDKTSERLVGIETALVELARLDKVEKEIREIDQRMENEVRDIGQRIDKEVRETDKRINAIEVRAAKADGVGEWTGKLVWQYLLWGGVFLFLVLNLVFGYILKK